MSDKKQSTRKSITELLINNPPIATETRDKVRCYCCLMCTSVDEYNTEFNENPIQWYKENYQWHDEDNCPYRQAVESLQDDGITPEKLEGLGFVRVKSDIVYYRLRVNDFDFIIGVTFEKNIILRIGGIPIPRKNPPMSYVTELVRMLSR